MAAAVVFPRAVEAADDFEQWWSRQGEWVEPPNRRRDGESGVQRLPNRQGGLLYCKRQIGHLYRSVWHPFGRPTVLRERDALQAFSRLGVRVPTIAYCGTQRQAGQWQALLITEELEDFVSLEQWYADRLDQRYGSSVHVRMLETIGLTLSRYHRARWQHGCCYPKHIFVKVTGKADSTLIEIALLDLEKSRRRLHPGAAAKHDLRQLARHRDAMPDQDWTLLQGAHAASFAQHGDAR
ncbi:lipopolysaccharide kinase InaA family protein [Stutzerimonas stutzeri]|uniref:lipopolysaccharide kinase InaA family protein n=1 Tax=Stutzerimonas stutzeri TaxID=316 RepID=UPI001C2EF4BB|nr:lipopolysaccharide kinase InaA family protein [Stutzerimonas stutzeri]